MIPIALFPIPECATFPGTVYPLHVFEPRYRQMVEECVKNNRMMGICHTESVLSPGNPNQTLEEALSTNQATYQPYLIFSAGKVIVETTLPDGRILINVDLQGRYRAQHQTQESPYAIYECIEYQDRPIPEDEMILAEDLQGIIVDKMIEVSKQTQMGGLQNFEHWRLMGPSEFSFQLFGIIKTNGDILQQVLQCRSPLERLNIARQLLRV